MCETYFHANVSGRTYLVRRRKRHKLLREGKVVKLIGKKKKKIAVKFGDQPRLNGKMEGKRSQGRSYIPIEYREECKSQKRSNMKVNEREKDRLVDTAKGVGISE